nr:ATP-binding protein [Pyxidicoccus fallax]
MEAANQGDFSHRVPVYGTHPLLDRLAETFNTGAERNARHSAFLSEVIRVAREVGVDGRLGGQVDVKGLTGLWKDLGDSVNALAASLTAQVRNLARVSEAVARGDLSEKVTVDVRGEPLVLKHTINTMVDQLQSFADEVTRVAKEVAPEVRAEEQPDSQGMSGLWKDLNDNVNFTEKLALASRYKSEFLANVSHELRTPLNSLLILARVLSENKDRHLSPKEVDYAKTIYASGSDLLDLINDILDLSKVEAGKMRVEPSDVSFADVKTYVERTFRHMAEQKRLGFSVALAEDLPPMRTDPMRLQQVLKNLLSNAFKFTDTGRVELHVAPVRDAGLRFDSEVLQQADTVVAFRVMDSGIGIPKDKQHLIFEAFQQADGSTTRKYGGTGLGLSISRELTRLLGGELRVESHPGKGSTFTLYLPRTYAGPSGMVGASVSAAVVNSEPPMTTVPLIRGTVETPPAQARTSPGVTGSASSPGQGHTSGLASGASGVTVAAPPPERPGAPPFLAGVEPGVATKSTKPIGRKVLVVEDDIRTAFTLTSVLEGRGLEVLHAENGREGVATLNAHPDVDAVLMDLVRPEMDGYEAMRAIRQDPRFTELLIIAVTANARKEDGEKCLAAGASAWLTRPVDAERLLALLLRN